MGLRLRVLGQRRPISLAHRLLAASKHQEGDALPGRADQTADHDDRVVPAHSFKYAAALQAAQAGEAPILIRIETRAGHGAGKPTSKVIEETADILAFLSKNLGGLGPTAAP